MTPPDAAALASYQRSLIEAVVDHIAREHGATFPKTWNTDYDDPTFGPVDSSQRGERVEAKQALISEIWQAFA